MKALAGQGGAVAIAPAAPLESSTEPVERHIAELLVREGQISADQLNYALRICDKLHSSRTLVSVLQELHFITADKLRATLNANALSVPLGALLVELGYLRSSDLKTALALQAEKPGRRKLGQILTE